MSESIIEIVKERIEKRHQGDKKQLEVIFSTSNRLLVEAPAGYGKTNTMISKIAYMVATNQIPNPKKMLALTFSVNAAYKIKKDATDQLPVLLEGIENRFRLNEKITVTNYHGFCRSVLKKYGWHFHSSLNEIDKIQSVDDSNIQNCMAIVTGLSYEDAALLSKYSDALKQCDEKYLLDHFHEYCDTVVANLLTRHFISYNAILALTIKLFIDKPSVLKFYQAYYTTVLVDEFQDTNTLSFWLLGYLATDESRLIFLGDSLQRIYGFIGAVPDLLNKSIADFKLLKIPLSKNYRFASNPGMLLLDSNIRRNAENPRSPQIAESAIIELTIADDQLNECVNVAEKAIGILDSDGGKKVAILVKQRGANVNKLIEVFNEAQIPFFYGLFTDDDTNYLKFHRECLFQFIELIKEKELITKKLCAVHLSAIKEIYKDEPTPLSDALLQLLQIFWSKIITDYTSFSNEEKIILIKDTFEHNGLKQYIEFIPANIIISTVHAAKGLEWDYVILPDMEQDSFPNWFGLCGACKNKDDCKLVVTKANEAKFLEELSVFYVAVTRARKQVFFTASRKALDTRGNERSKNLSCFLNLPGIATN